MRGQPTHFRGRKVNEAEFVISLIIRDQFACPYAYIDDNYALVDILKEVFELVDGHCVDGIDPDSLLSPPPVQILRFVQDVDR